jgi:tRNA(fMet)-specific endonuclease VapC
MRSILVDTDVISFLFKRDTRATRYEAHLDEALQLMSFMTLAELEKWAVWRNWGKKRRLKLEEYLTRYTLILPDRDLCLKWAEVSAQAQRSGNVIETADAWIAATALLYDVPLVTHNRRHYIAVQGLTILSDAPM